MSYNRESSGSSSCTMKVDSSDVGKIIGRGGTKIRDLEQSYHVRIKIDREANEQGMKCVEICGSEVVLEKARRAVEDCLSGADFDGGRRGGYGGGRGGGGYGGGGRRGDSRGDSGSYGRRDRDGGDSWGRRDDRESRGGGRGGFGEGSDSETIFVESSEVGRIIGRGGCRIRDMEQDSGCKIKVARDDHHGRSSVELCGSKSAITEAKRMIQDAGVEIVNGDDRGRGW